MDMLDRSTQGSSGGGSEEDPTVPSAHEDPATEIERLRRERDELAAELEGRRGDGAGERTHRVRRILTPILVTLTVLSLAVAVPGSWVRRTFTNTERYVATVAPLRSDPAVQAYLADQITTRVFAALGVAERIDDVLGERAPRLVFLAGPLSNAVEGYVRDQVEAIVASDTFQRFWAEASTRVHATAIAVLNGDSEVVQVSNGQVVLNLLPVINAALVRVSDFASSLLDRPVSIPPITSGDVPSEAVARIESATGVELPDDFGQLAVADADRLTSVQAAYTLFNRGVIIAVVSVVLFLALALLASTRRRRTLIQIMVASAVVLVLERRFAIAAGDSLVDDASADARGVVRSAVDVLSGSLLEYTGWLLAVALIVLAAALISGPYPWAVRLRRGAVALAASVTGAVRERRPEAASVWVAAHRDPLLLGGAIVGLLLLWVLELSVIGFLIIVLLLAAYSLVVWRVAASGQTDIVPKEAGT